MAPKYNQQSFIEQSTLKHNGLYSYKNVQFNNTKQKVIITCSIHGDFEQTAAGHLRGNGCKQCTSSGGKGVYSNNYFEKWPEDMNKDSILYVIKMSYEQQEWIKVGITVSTVSERYSKQIFKEMDIHCIRQIRLPLYDAFCREQEILTDLKQYKFTHPVKFSGRSECFYLNDHVTQYIASII